VLQLFDASTNFVPRGVGRGRRLNPAAGKCIEQCETRGSVERQYRFILGVDCGEMGSKLAEDGDGGGLIVDEDAALAGGGNLAANDQRAVFGFIQTVVLQNFIDCVFRNSCALKYRGDDRAVRAGADYLARRFIAQEQSQSIDQNGFASAGFTGEHVEAGGKLHRCVVNDGVVFQAQFDKHVASWVVMLGFAQHSMKGSCRLPVVGCQLANSYGILCGGGEGISIVLARHAGLS